MVKSRRYEKVYNVGLMFRCGSLFLSAMGDNFGKIYGLETIPYSLFFLHCSTWLGTRMFLSDHNIISIVCLGESSSGDPCLPLYQRNIHIFCLFSTMLLSQMLAKSSGSFRGQASLWSIPTSLSIPAIHCLLSRKTFGSVRYHLKFVSLFG